MIDEIVLPKMKDNVFPALKIKGLRRFECAKYARLAARVLSDSKYIPGDAWELGEKNEIIKQGDLNLRKETGLLIPGQSIVIFHNPDSRYNREGIIGTHAGVYLGKNGDLYFANQFFIRQRKRSYRTLLKEHLKPKQILASKKE